MKADATRHPGSLLRPQALAGEGCIEWFRPTERRSTASPAFLVSAAILCAALVPAMAVTIDHGRTVVLQARIEAPDCHEGSGPCTSQVVPMPHDIAVAMALEVGDRLEAGFADGSRHTLVVSARMTGRSVGATWPRRGDARQGVARIRSTRRASLLGWIR